MLVQTNRHRDLILYEGGLDGHAATFTNISSDGNLHKLVIVKGAEGAERAIRDFRLSSVEIEALFRAKAPPPRLDYKNGNDSGWGENRTNETNETNEASRYDNHSGNDYLWGEHSDSSWRERRAKNDSGESSTNYTTTSSSYNTPSNSQGKVIDPFLVGNE